MTTSSSFECNFGSRGLTVETGKLANQAGGAVTLRCGDTMVLVTATTSKKPREGIDFLPLTIDYEERQYAAGKIPGGFFRREGRPTEEATLAARQTDRPLRPLLPPEWRREIQVIITVLSVDHENDPDILAIIGGSAALSISEIPFDGPVSAVHVGYINDELVINPTFTQLEDSPLDIVVVSTKEAIVMLEAGAKEVSEDIVTRAIQLGHEANQAVIKLQEDLRKAVGKPKVEAPRTEVNPELIAAISQTVNGKLAPALGQTDKASREEALSNLKSDVLKELGESFAEADIRAAFGEKVKKEVRALILNKGQRPSGRRLDEIRPLSCEVGILPRVHGSALFSRGETQVMTVTTLGSLRKEQQIDSIGVVESKRFMHHYNFAPYSVGEVKRVGSANRREIGHGALAERALLPVLPGEEDYFPYTLRLVSEVLSSNGSTSMASVCASSLSLMEAGVPIKKAVAGISIGLVADDGDNFAILTDIEGLEDHYGDMDFKVAGTTDGITAIQLDIKLKGINMAIIEQALKQAKEARLFILDKMRQAISESRPELNPHAPRMYKLSIDTDKIGAVIGPGGKTIRSITEETNATIDVENDGTVYIGSADEESAQKAIKLIEYLTKDVEVGATYSGKVTRLMNFGAFVEVLPGRDGLIHISELDHHHVDKVEDIVKVGDEVTVKVIEIDSQGRINLSRRAVLEKPAHIDAAKDADSPRPDYPFKGRGDTRPSPRPRPSPDKRRY